MIPNADMSYSQGDDVTLQCTAMGGPDNTFQWLQNGMVLMSENSEMLTVMNVTAANGGAYTCEVANAAGTSNTTASVFISPYFTSQPQAIGADNGTMVTLTCVAEAFPAPEYQWSRVDGEDIRMEVTDQDSTMLVFDPLLFGDEGNYFCTALSNGDEAQSENVTLTGTTITLLQSPINFFFACSIPSR